MTRSPRLLRPPVEAIAHTVTPILQQDDDARQRVHSQRDEGSFRPPRGRCATNRRNEAELYGFLRALGRRSHAGTVAKAKQTAQAFLLAAQAGGGRPEIAAAHRALGWSCFALGETQSALSEYQCVGSISQSDNDNGRPRRVWCSRKRGRASAAGYGYRSCACWVAGDAEPWRAAKAAAVDRAEALGHAPTSVNIYWLAASTSIIRLDAEAARSEAAREQIDLLGNSGAVAPNIWRMAKYAWGGLSPIWGRLRPA